MTIKLYRNDYFKSVIVADKYFKDKKEKLYDYHLVLLGDTPNQKCII